MDENTTSWKSHSFTLMIFAGIVVLSSIFFVLGMLVGRYQGQHAAEVASDQSSRKPGAESGAEDFPLTFYDQSTEEKPDNKLQPVPAASAQPVAPALPTPPASKNAPSPAPSESKNDKKSATPPKPASPPDKPTPKASPDANVYLQVASVKTEKQGTTELKKVQSKGFKATMRPVKVSGEMVYRILVGPYKESELKNAKAALLAKGYKDPVVR